MWWYCVGVGYTVNKHMKHDEDSLRERLSETAYQVTQEGATEPPFTGTYYEAKDDGMYHCVVCDAPLFSSETKFDSGSGWPSFYDAAQTDALRLTTDTSGGMIRTEASCRACGAHLGHVFDDAPKTPTGKRYCINSCALSLNKQNDESEAP